MAYQELSVNGSPRQTAAVERVVEARLPTVHGEFRAIGYMDRRTNQEQVALVHGDITAHGALTRVHSECLTGEVFGSNHCECGDQLGTAMRMMVADGSGILVYIQGHEGRGIGLLAKLKAMHLQQAEGLDTVEANLALGLPVDDREYTVAVEILNDLGVESVRLLSNNPLKREALEANGITIAERIPLLIPPNKENHRYLLAKRKRLDHSLPHLDGLLG
ncbi:GTP cyclohydrolase II [Streptomyces bathyalis]|uniref:GTP cyclohydrolase-2 n=1 Tax=Streptomyces bathyalis TaxID=2710756 RepID=A0A7T1TCE8_9ACTN|nr:GTP cyclohydrolase II [Streptomyces bathyalis]QPP10354.1 GTP cyclohydrolase II [Streptomyces bathyalis]